MDKQASIELLRSAGRRRQVENASSVPNTIRLLKRCRSRKKSTRMARTSGGRCRGYVLFPALHRSAAASRYRSGQLDLRNRWRNLFPVSTPL